MKSFSADINGNHFAGLQWGNKNKPVLLALHGWLDNAASFVPLADALSTRILKDDFPYQLIAIDLPGHGKSYHKQGHYHFVDWIDDIYQLITQSGWQSVTLMGHSMGAMITSIFAATFPELVDKVILIEGVGAISSNAEQAVSQLRKGVESRSDYYDQTQRLSKKPLLLDKVIKARCRVSDLSAENAKLICNRNLTSQKSELVWSSDPKLKSISLLRFTDNQVISFLSSISMPCKIVKATNGFPLIANALKLPVFNKSNFEIFEVEGGHHIHMESPLQLEKILF